MAQKSQASRVRFIATGTITPEQLEDPNYYAHVWPQPIPNMNQILIAVFLRKRPENDH